jgi:tetratricopeptide (TPR) repeat protein
MRSLTSLGKTAPLFVVLVVLASCATQPEPKPAVAPPAPQPVPPPPPSPPPPRVPTAEERQRAEQLANESILQLQAGESENGKKLLEQAQALDPNNELARLMMRQITADPVAELGSVNFNYTIQRDDTLAKLAQRFLGDRHLFYILARYNDIASPNRIQLGQVIKIPGKAPARGVEPQPAAEPVKTAPAAPAPKAVDPNAKLLAEASELERRGDLEGALTAYAEVLRQDPTNAEARQHSVAVRKKLIDRYYAEGTAAFARQDLDKAIAAWDRVLALDPDNQNAKLKREQAIDLKERLKRFDSGKK